MQPNPILLVSWINFLLNFAIQGSLIFIPLLGAQLGASDLQVGLIGGAYGGAYLLSSLYSGRQSDRRGRLGFVRTGLLFCAVAFAAQLSAHHLYTLVLVRSGVGLALGVTMAAFVAYAFDFGSDMGRFSSYGSLGWIAGALTAAFLKDFNLLFVVSFLCCAAAFALSLLFPPTTRTAASSAGTSPIRLRDIIKSGLPVYLAVFLRHLGAMSVWIILPLYFTSLGLDRFWVGLLWGINFTVQAVVMRYLERFDPKRVFTLGQVLSIIVFVVFTVVHERWSLVATQVLLGVAWSCLYVGALLLVLRTGESKGTASGIFQATLNLCGAVGPFLGGMIAQGFGYRGVMLFAAALGVAGLMIRVPQTRLQQLS
jgi:MFS family permease